MHLLVCLVGLVSLAWHTSGYAYDYAATSVEYDDDTHKDPVSTPDVNKEGEKKKGFDIMNMTDAQIKAYILLMFGDETDYEYYDPLRPKRSIPEGESGDEIEEIETTEHIEIPDSKEPTIDGKNDTENTEDLKKAVEIANPTVEDTPQKTEALQSPTEHAIEDREKPNKNVNSQETEEAIEQKKVFQNTGDHEIKEDDTLEHKLREIEKLEHVIEEIDTLLQLEEIYLTMDGGQIESLAEVERTERDSEWFGPIYPEYLWYPYWYPPVYPWELYPVWPPYNFNPYPVAFPVNGNEFNSGASESGTVKQYVPVKGKVTTAATFTGGTWSLPPSSSVPKVIDPCFYSGNGCTPPRNGQGYRSEPAAVEVATAPCVKLGSIPVSGKSTFAAHFC